MWETGVVSRISAMGYSVRWWQQVPVGSVENSGQTEGVATVADLAGGLDS